MVHLVGNQYNLEVRAFDIQDSTSATPEHANTNMQTHTHTHTHTHIHTHTHTHTHLFLGGGIEEEAHAGR
jgi:hypothetical protein